MAAAKTEASIIEPADASILAPADASILAPADKANLLHAATNIRNADVIVLYMGAGWGVPSSFGTFRGKAAGCWPPLATTGFRFEQLSCPAWFSKLSISADGDILGSCRLAYAFWQWRRRAYRAPPHVGYGITVKLMASKVSSFSVTSNVDGAWRKAGCTRIINSGT